MSARKQTIRAVANRMVTENVKITIDAEGYTSTGGSHAAIKAACMFLRDSKKEFNYSEVFDTVCDIIKEREEALRMKSKL